MDTSPLEQKIASIEAEIAADYEKIERIKQDAANHIDLIKRNIAASKGALREYNKGLNKIRQKYNLDGD